MQVIDAHLGHFIPDGRSCEHPGQCLGIDAEPGVEYDCQRIGLFGTTALDDRVRYRGILQDPNELALAVCIAIPLLFSFYLRSRRRSYALLAVVGVAIATVFQCVVYTQSRGGILVFLAVIGVYVVRRYGVRSILLSGFALLPLMAMGGRSGAAADASTMERYEAWRTGLQMLKSNPVLGVGQGMFPHIHYLTAHNSYLLPASELGFMGMFLWVSVLYLSIKIALVALLDFHRDPRADAACVWAMAILGIAAGSLLQMMFLSLTYHSMTWIFFGMCGAFHQCVKRHEPRWEVRFGPADAAAVVFLSVGFLAALSPFLTLKGV
jgi:O-antigen ligase